MSYAFGRAEAAVAVAAGAANVAGVAATYHWGAGGSVLGFGRVVAVVAWRLDVATGRRVVGASVVVEAVTLADSPPVPSDSSVMPPMRLDRLPGSEPGPDRPSGLDFGLVATGEVVAVVDGALLVEPSGHGAAPVGEPSALGSIAVHHSAYSSACLAAPDFAAVVA
jgi:hypothetical protein